MVIVRHGQSQWNLENRFTGEVDIPLTSQGREEARAAGEKLRKIDFNAAFTSLLVRAEETLQIILTEIGQTHIPVIRDHALNERNYGQLQGLNKSEVAATYGEEQVVLWRRSYDAIPPGGESLKDTFARVIPYYELAIEPLVINGENILIVAHGNSLRALMMHLEAISAEQIAHIDLPTGIPRMYRMEKDLKIKEAVYL